MAIELKMPALSPTMEKGTLARWLVKVGESVKSGDMIAEIETDKATMEFEVADEGTVTKLVISEGTDDVAVGTVIALLSEAEAAVAAPAVAEPVSAAAPAVGKAEPVPPPAAAIAPPAAQRASAPAAASPLLSETRIDATPLAKRIAAAQGISLAGLAGSGPRGRIVKADLGLPPLVAPAIARMASPVAIAPQAMIAPPPAGVPVETIKLTTMRKTIARRLSESKQTVPHFYLTSRCNLDALLKLRSELNASLDARGIKLSVNDLLIKALALALVQVPDANVQFAGDELYRFGRVDVSMAVAIEGGLITPVIKGADSLSLSAIALQAKTLAAKAREGKLAPEDYHGGTVSISNLGMFGIDEMFPVINPPQALILGVGAGVEQPWKVNGEIGKIGRAHV